MRFTLLFGVLFAQLCWAGTAHAQSLGDVARQEEVRRKGVKAPSKVYTNESLRSDGSPAPSPSATAPVPSPAAVENEPSTPAPAEPRAEVRDEKYWRGRIDTARASLARAQTLVEALQSRVNALSADFVNRDDPAQRNVIAAERQKALAELERVKLEIVQQQKAIVDTQEEARRANVPAGWVR